MTIRIQPNGPHVVIGPLAIEDGDGDRVSRPRFEPEPVERG